MVGRYKEIDGAEGKFIWQSNTDGDIACRGKEG